MTRKSKGRQKTKMVKMEKENNLQVTFSKRKNGLFKKASELCTLCDAHIAVIVFSPSGKVYSFGHLDVETIINRFENNDHPLPNPQPNMQLDEIHRHSPIRDLNNHLTEVMNQLEFEQKNTEELKKKRKNSKIPEIWLKESIGGLDLGQAKEFKGKLENLKKQVTHVAFRIFQERYPHPSFYVGSSTNALFGVDGGINVNPNLNLFHQRRMVNVNNLYNHNMSLPNHPLPFGNYSHADPNPNENQNPSDIEEKEAGSEHHHDGHPPHPRSD
ncbi:hypothetical protein N665_0224s0018 [Sinapis alba]|nr:hypothetical protein N665_0224s0018 [Sinapis alba]